MREDEEIVLIKITQEKKDLDEKINNLNNFVDTVKFNRLSKTMQLLLAKQLNCMREYSSILDARISELSKNLK